MNAEQKIAAYEEVIGRINAVIEGETDSIAVMSTVACELHQSMEYFHWTGFYRVTAPDLLTVGPYQGGHGCLRIHFSQGICGRAARTMQTVIIEDVNSQSDHIACATSTLSEIVVPLLDQQNQLIAVLDVDSDLPAAFDNIDQQYLEKICHKISATLNS